MVPSLDLEFAIDTGGEGPKECESEGRPWPFRPRPTGCGSGWKPPFALLYGAPLAEPVCGGVTRSPRLKDSEGEYGEPERPALPKPFMLAHSFPGVIDEEIDSERGTALISASGASNL